MKKIACLILSRLLLVSVGCKAKVVTVDGSKYIEEDLEKLKN
ncbi:MAG: hypothetical protein S4CHLAM45_10950 [Chlamydiales bacterium]|nr:hypothetical protein [Chlamydiales bacterium]MCH9619587.1 hypothetical protein [Chlamydiales bacterium]MCH9623193.1 hypothetical protein [Chlamydiales bacterium]